MRLYVMRHGIAVERGAPECPDDGERPLTPDGRRKVRAAARGLRELGPAPELILTSPLARCRETAEIVAEVLARGTERVRESEALRPEAPLREALSEVRGLVQHEAAMVVGHEPGLGGLISLLLCGDDSALDVSLKKAGVCVLELREEGPARLSGFLRPATLRALGRVGRGG